MELYRDKLDDLFIDKLNYEFTGEILAKPDIEGKDNIIEISKEYSGNGIDVLVVECYDRILEFQKKLIKNQKNYFPNSHFLFISNSGKVFDLYNISTSKKLKPITYNEIDKNISLFQEKIELFNIDEAEDSVDLRIRIEKAFETNDKVTKKFFDKFKSIHKKLQKAINGIENKEDIEWYASVLMNRIMFIYFLQKHYVIQNDPNFLITKYDEVKLKGEDYYKDFLLPLFFYGFAKRDSNPFKQEFVEKYGEVKYLNGGLFYPHYIEKKYYNEIKGFDPGGEKYINTKIEVDAKILNEILTFLNGYSWYLDHRPMKEDTDINPDVLGYIFEKYINQKELGAYYTKEDITEYIAKNTIIPFIFDKLKNNGYQTPDPTDYITQNNLGDSNNNKLLDYIEQSDNYEIVKFLYKDILCELSILDPAVGSGAFLFAALNILLPIYRKTIFKLKSFRETQKDVWLTEFIEKLAKHSEEYYITKQIILNNLYGVDIVEEATEICKLRLFLLLASHLPDIKEIEPLPDIDFNIYAGNSLVGGLNWEDLQNNYTMDIFTSANRDKIKENITQLTELKQEYKIVNEQIAELAALKEEYKKVQQEEQNEEKLAYLKNQIEFLEHQLNGQINVGIDNPFHWFIEFDSILKKGGFDVIIGNPPYVEYSKVKKEYELSGYSTIKCGNLYANFIERSIDVLIDKAKFGMIIPISFSCTKRMAYVQNEIEKNSKNLWISHFAERPSKLFSGAEVLLDIVIFEKGKPFNLFVTGFNKWNSTDREELLSGLKYNKGFKLREYLYPKFQDNIESLIWEKISSNKPLGSFYSSEKNNKVYYRIGGGRYWKIFTTFQPKFALNGHEQASSRENHLFFRNEKDKNIAISVLSSSLFYWYFLNTTNCRDLNPFDLQSFPVNLEEMHQNIRNNLSELCIKLMNDYEKNSQIKNKISKKTGNVTYQEFYPRLSKNIIDLIDLELGKHYGLSKEEIDFIINYDIKFRIGEEDEE